MRLKKILALVLCFAMLFSTMNFSVFAEDSADLTISTADELKAFAAEVNEGNSYEGKTVVLADNIDMEYNAVVIGTKTNPFKGIFDGKGYTVSNLTIYEDGSESDYFADSDDCLGLFGVINTPAIIKNVTVHNPFIVGSSYVGGIVGMGYTGAIENCHVTGEIDIEGFYMVGGINGHGYAKISNCSVVGEEGWAYSWVGATYKESDLEGDNVGGIVGHNGENNDIIGCEVKNVTVSGTRKVGGIVGIAALGSDITDCTVSNIAVETTASEEYATAKASTMSIGGLVGQYQKNGSGGTISGCEVTGLTFENKNDVIVSAGSIAGGFRGANGIEEPVITVSDIIVEDVSGATNDYLVPHYVATVDGVGYEALQEAINVANDLDGEVTITISDTITENVIVNEKVGLYLTIDGANNTMNGTITVKALSDTNDNRRITIKNIDFITEADSITSVDTNHYPRITVQNCSFTGTDKTKVAVRLKSSSDTVIKDCQGTGLHSFLQNTSGWNLTIDNVDVSDSKSGLSLGTVQGVTVKNCDVDVNNYGIRLDADTYNNNAVVEDCNVTAYIPVVVRKVNTESSLTFNGTSTMTATNDDGVWCAIGKEEYEEGVAVPTAPTKVTVALNDTGLDASGVVGELAPTEVDTYEELVAALEAGEDVILTADITATAVDGTDAIIDLGGNTLTLTAGGTNFFGTSTIKNGTIDISGCIANGDCIIGIGDYSNNATLNLENVNIVGDGYSSAYAVLYVYGSSTLNINGGSIVVANDNAAAGGVIKASDAANGKINITGTASDPVELAFTDAKIGILDGTVVMDYVDLDINGGANAINESVLTVKNSTLTIKDCDGRALTLNEGDITIENSVLDFSGATEGEIRFKKALTLNVDANSEIKPCTIWTGVAGANVNGTPVTGTENDPSKVTVINGTTTIVTDKDVAQIGGVYYKSIQEALDAANAGDTIKLLANVEGGITVPADVIFNGNGFSVSGGIIADGNITFAGITKAKDFDVNYSGTIINIGVGASLELTGTDRLVVGHGCTFNIEGDIIDAKTANVAELTPSLIMPGASFTGAGVTFNVKNAYIKTTASYCSTSKSASGTFDFNIENSIWEQFGKLAFEAQSTAATVNFVLKDSVLTTTSHLVFGVSAGEIVIDNSNVNVGTSRQIENRSTMTIKNGSVVNGAVATSSNAINSGTVIVEDATYAVTGQFSGSTVGTGTLIVKKGANVSVGSIADKANIVVDAAGMTAGETINFNANLSKFAGTMEVINNDTLGAEYDEVNKQFVLVVKPVAQIGDNYYNSLSEAFAAVVDGDTVTLLADITLDSMLTVPNGVEIILNLNGKTITGTDNTSKNFSLIDNRGTLTITGDGTMTLTATIDSDWGRYSAVLANNPGGKLIVESGTIEHLGGTDMAYGIDNLTNGKGTYAETIINGGTIKSTYRGIRQFLNGVEAQNILTVNGGIIEGENKSIFFHDPSNKANSGTLTVGENAELKGDVYLFVTAGSTEWPVEVSIAAASLAEGSTVVSANIPSKYEINETNGAWGVKLGVAVNVAIDGTAIKATAICEDANVLIIATYKDKEVVGFEKIDTTVGLNEITATITADSKEVDTVKAFLWKDFASMAPVCNSAAVTLGE